MSDTKEKQDGTPDPDGDWESPVIPPPIKEKKNGDGSGKKEWEPPIPPPAK